MAVYRYRKFKISISEDSKKVQGLRVGDIVRRQYFDSPNLIYTLMCVLAVGVDKIKVEDNGVIKEKSRSWFVGALLEGEVPSSNEVLDFVRVTNLWDANRLGAIYMTASDQESPYIDVISGIAVEQSLCYPTGINDASWVDSFSQYTVVGKDYVTSSYQNSEQDNNRICTITKNDTAATPQAFIGLSQLLDSHIENPNRVLISYKIKSSRPLSNLVASLEYEDGTRVDGTLNVESTTEWQYKFHAITIDYSGRYKRVFKLNLNDGLQNNDSVSIADFNIILLSSVANFAGGMKMRMGNLEGIIDPVFGELDNYGAYTQRLYATQQVNISGTLTAGDENGFGCTFYAGKIHKNVIINSIACDFDTETVVVPTDDSPVGVGEVYSSDSQITLNAQTNSWMLGHLGQQYCFSVWLKSKTTCDVAVSQNNKIIKVVSVNGDGIWKRHSVSFRIQEPKQTSAQFQIGLLPSSGTLFMTAPQLEKGNAATQYQPTDDVLDYVEDYGAWFNKGGIGGTIQNPLLKLNEDGSISSKNDSFVINHDGTGHFANGRFKWTQNEIILQGVTIKWGDLDSEAQEAIKPKSISILGTNVFVVDKDSISPSEITLQIKETNFTSTPGSIQWFYLYNGDYVKFDGANDRTINILPNAEYWHGESYLTIKCSSTHNLIEYFDTITIQRVENGDDAYWVQILTSNGNTFKNGIGTTTLTAHVYRGGIEITDQLFAKDFDWIKTSSNPDTDRIFNQAHVGWGNVLSITSEDIWNMAQFDCKVRIN